MKKVRKPLSLEFFLGIAVRFHCGFVNIQNCQCFRFQDENRMRVGIKHEPIPFVSGLKVPVGVLQRFGWVFNLVGEILMEPLFLAAQDGAFNRQTDKITQEGENIPFFFDEPVGGVAGNAQHPEAVFSRSQRKICCGTEPFCLDHFFVGGIQGTDIFKESGFISERYGTGNAFGIMGGFGIEKSFPIPFGVSNAQIPVFVLKVDSSAVYIEVSNDGVNGRAQAFFQIQRSTEGTAHRPERIELANLLFPFVLEELVRGNILNGFNGTDHFSGRTFDGSSGGKIPFSMLAQLRPESLGLESSSDQGGLL